MIARLDKTYYFADFMGRKRFNYSFLQKQYHCLVQKKLQNRKFVVFKQFIEHFLFQNSTRRFLILFMMLLFLILSFTK